MKINMENWLSMFIIVTTIADVEAVEFNCDADRPMHSFDSSAFFSDDDDNAAIKIHFKEIVGFGVRPRPWDYYQPSSETDVCLVVIDKRFYQNKKILAYQSAYFKSLFYGDFCEKNKYEVEIKDVSAADFTNLLDALHGSFIAHPGNIEQLLKTADRFDVYIATERCEQYLMIDTFLSKYKKILLSDKYRLPRLQAKLLSDWTAQDAMVVFKGKDEYVKRFSKEILAICVQIGWTKITDDTTISTDEYDTDMY